jgi:hypothetical protein
VPTPCRAVDDRRRRGRTRHRLRRAEIDLALSYEQKADDIAFEPLAQLPTYICLPGTALPAAVDCHCPTLPGSRSSCLTCR